MTLRRADESLRTALVTGACSGIGLELARLLGSLGYELVLASNREEQIRRTAAEISEKHGVATFPVAIDLGRAEAAGELYRAVRARGLAVDILANNAGMFFFGEAVDADPARAVAMLHLHVVTPSLLCTYFARDMRARRRGHVLIVSSISAWRDFPGIAYYGSSKKYLRGFARALRSELGVHGVNVTCLAPGATATGLYDARGLPVDLAVRIGLMASARSVAEAGLRGMFRGEAEVVPGAINRALAGLAALTPQVLLDAIRRRAPWLPPLTPSGGVSAAPAATSE